MGAPVGNTCPDIDQVIEAIKESLKCYNNICSYVDDLQDTELTDRQSDWLSYLKSETDEIEHHLWGLEDLRNTNSKLREWGEELESEKYDFENELSTLEDRVRDLENENEKLLKGDV